MDLFIWFPLAVLQLVIKDFGLTAAQYDYNQDYGYPQQYADEDQGSNVVLCYDCRYEYSADGHTSGDEGCVSTMDNIVTTTCTVPDASCMKQMRAHGDGKGFTLTRDCHSRCRDEDHREITNGDVQGYTRCCTSSLCNGVTSSHVTREAGGVHIVVFSVMVILLQHAMWRS